LQAPAKNLAIASGQKAATAEARSRTDQRFQTLVVFGDGMGEEGNIRGVASYRAKMLHDPRRSGLDGILEFAAAVVSVYPRDRSANLIDLWMFQRGSSTSSANGQRPLTPGVAESGQDAA
jgi:hypothetical protein